MNNIQVQCYPPLRHLYFDFGDFNFLACRVMDITVAESDPDMGFYTQQIFGFSPNVLATANKTQIATVSIAADRS